MDGFVRMRAALPTPALATGGAAMWRRPSSLRARELAEQLSHLPRAVLALFAGCDAWLPPGKPTAGGLPAISDFMEANVPEAERSRAGEVLIRILNGTLFELVGLTRKCGLKPWSRTIAPAPS